MSKTKSPEERQRRDAVKARRAALREENKKFPADKLVRISQEAFPKLPGKTPPRDAWRSRDYLVLVFEDKGRTRLSICRADINADGNWRDDISWDELFQIKCAVGYPHHDAVEVYPDMDDYVNVSNMRHLWICDEPLDFKWRNKKSSELGPCVVKDCDGAIIRNDEGNVVCDTCKKEYPF